MIPTKVKNEISIFAKGLNPITDAGYEYEATTQNWFCLWLYVAETCEDLLTDNEAGYGFYPKHLSFQLSQESAIKLAYRLLDNINSGKTQEYIEKTYKVDHYFSLTLEDVKDFAHFCGVSGGFILQ